MNVFPEEEVLAKIRTENPWWQSTSEIPYSDLVQRPYLDLLTSLIESPVRRSVILVGPRRVGKTVMLHHLVQEMISKGRNPQSIAMLSIDNPIYNGMGLEGLISLIEKDRQLPPNAEQVIIFDEIQYLKDWEVHLKVLQDHRPTIRFIASGSAAAALKRKSAESGAGRFTDFFLPPLTFIEYLALTPGEPPIKMQNGQIKELDLPALQQTFIKYINFGGYPEVALSASIQGNRQRFVKSDIIDKVLLRDLPQLYGIQDIQELNRLFTALAYRTGEEVNPSKLASQSSVNSATIRKYLQYLEAAFLIKTVSRVDQNSRRFKRQGNYKVYLTNPSMRAALFDPVNEEHNKYGHLVETAVFTQWFHGKLDDFHYARWDNGEVDFVKLEPAGTPSLVVEVKSGDREAKDPSKLKSLLSFCRKNNCNGLVTTRSAWKTEVLGGVTLNFIPVSVYTYWIGQMILESNGPHPSAATPSPPSTQNANRRIKLN